MSIIETNMYRTAAAEFRALNKSEKGGYILFIKGVAHIRIAGLNSKYKGNPYYPVEAVVVPDDGSPVLVNRRTILTAVDRWEPVS